MPPSEQPRVFISYARKDGAALAQRLQKDLNERGLDAWLDSHRLSGSAVWSTELDNAIDSSQVVIAVLTSGSYESRMCHGEQLRALDKGKRLIPVLAERGADRTTYLYALQLRDFTNTDHANYTARLAELLADIRGDATATLPDAYRKTRVTHLTAPPRVANYLERPEALQVLRDALFAEDHRQPIALTALAGMGGIGKTVLAKALTDDEVVQRAFPDGIVWVTAGKESQRDFLEEMREVAKALGDDLSNYYTALACVNQYRTTIASKAALIVVDDVWSVDDIKPLLAESPRSRFLFTTRDASIGRFVGAHEHRADLLDIAQSRELLASWASIPLAELPPVADAIIHECGRLPLALSVVGAMLRDADPSFWEDTLELLRKADLSAIEEQLPPGQASFYKSVDLSFQFLVPTMQERYKALAVLLEDMPAALRIQQMLWKAREDEARRTRRHLVDRSLAFAGNSHENIRLHDLQLDYVRAQSPYREALGLIHDAIRRSAQVIDSDPSQFGSQLVARLLYRDDQPSVREFLEFLSRDAPYPWLRPLSAALEAPSREFVRALVGHKSFVNAVVVTPDGRRAVSASHDQTLKVWDLHSGRELRTLIGHASHVMAVAVTADGKRVVSASWDNTVRVWDLATGRELQTLSGHTAHVTAVAVTADGKRVVSASWDNTVRVWDLSTGNEPLVLCGHSKWITAVAVAADGSFAISASNDKTLKVWDLAKGCELHTLSGHSDFVTGVSVTGDGKRAVSGSEDGTVKVWELASGRELCSISGHSGGVTSVAVTVDGRQAVSATRRELKVWELTSGRELHSLHGHFRVATALAVTPDGTEVVSASEDHTLIVWDLTTAPEPRAPSSHEDRVSAVAVTPDGQRAVSASWDQTVKIWDPSRRDELCTLSIQTGKVNLLAVTADACTAVSASEENTVEVWDLSSGRELRRLTGHKKKISAVAVTPDGQRAVSSSEDGELKVWDLISGRELLTLTLPRDSMFITAVAITADGRQAFTACNNRTLIVWDLIKGKESHAFDGHRDLVTTVAITPDGRRGVSSSADKTVKVWELANRNIWGKRGRPEPRTLYGHADVVTAVTLTADGQRAVSASADKTVKVWELRTGRCLATFTCDSTVHCCAVSNSSKLIIAGDAGGQVFFLRLEEPKAKS